MPLFACIKKNFGKAAVPAEIGVGRLVLLTAMGVFKTGVSVCDLH
jgi:hypothetical protein